jgi:AcrR family transcriptional regulator
MTPADAAKLGRKRDHTRDPEILQAALDVLAETGYEGMTIDMVATRAKAGKATLYRRWPSKAALIVEAVACMKNANYDEASLPDTGTLRGDLIALTKPHAMVVGGQHLQIVAGIISMLSREPGLREAVQAAFIAPRAAAYGLLIRRAIERGEISADCDVETLASIGPAVAMYRALLLQKPVDREFSISLIDNVVLPAVGLGRS